MTCEGYQFPINLKLSNHRGNCSSNCKVECKYHNSSCIATNNGTYFSLSYDRVQIPPIKFNDVSLDVKEVRLYSPSLHKYEGIKEDGEMIILHKGNDMSVAICIPIKLNNDDKSSFLNEIIEKCGMYIQNEDETTTLNLSEYNLTNFIPMNSPFMNYSCNMPFDCNVIYDVIVFGNKNEYISINTENLNTIRACITSESYNNIEDMNYFVNTGGVTKKMSDTYIRCFNKNEIPDDIPSYEDSKEGFVNMSELIQEKNSFHVGYIFTTGVFFYGLYYFIDSLMITKGKKKK
jgi:hypothetical protein